MKTQPYMLRDFRKGVQRQSAISNFLIPENSASNSVNINYDKIIGSAVVRDGTTKLGATVASGKTPLGLYNFVNSGATTNVMLAVYPGATTASIYYYNGSWNTSGTTTLSNSYKNRFATIGSRVFRASQGNAMTSSADGNTWDTTNCITTDSVVPTLLYSNKGRLLASGYSGFRDRIYFSSIIDQNASPTLTWNTNPDNGDWIDINPDDGGNITGFAEASGLVLVFKDTGLYRLNAISRVVDPTPLFNIGAVSQEAIVNCMGVVYYFSGIDIRQTFGGYPQQISRLGVQDFIDAIPQSNWSSVSAGTDGLNVYFSIGNVTLDTNEDNQTTYTNVVLKFSPRDQSWSVHSYADKFDFFSLYKTTSGLTMVGADENGDVQTLNSGTTDNGAFINYLLETQDIDCGNRGSLKALSDMAVVFTQYGLDSNFHVKSDISDTYKPIKADFNKKVSIAEDMPAAFEGHYFNFKWFGQVNGKAPIFEGFYLPNITDKGVTNA